MKLSRSLVALAVGLAYGIIVNFFPDFPVSQEILLGFVIWALILLGVEITEPVVREALIRRGFRGFIEYDK